MYANRIFLLALFFAFIKALNIAPGFTPNYGNCDPYIYCNQSRYRTIDGTCNNLVKTSWGKSVSPYSRIVPYNVKGGSISTTSVYGYLLPTAHNLSNLLFPPYYLNDLEWNLNTMQYGQLVAHDMSLTMGLKQSHYDQLHCCCDDTNENSAIRNLPTDVSLGLVRSGRGTKCFCRKTQTTKDNGCFEGPTRPLTEVTSYLDLSVVYGNNKDQANAVRAWKGGQLLSDYRYGREWLPQNPDPTTCQLQNSYEPCFLAGDVRVNQNPQLTVLQTIFLREHNRIAATLQRLNPHWVDEKIFQEARRILIAIYQHITYYEHLPALLGYEYMVQNKLIYPYESGYVNDYNPKVDPSVLDEHGTAGFRVFHTLVQGYLQLISKELTVTGQERLSDWFNRPALLFYNDVFSELARGFTFQPESYSDQYVDAELTRYLFRGNNATGADLKEVDISRAREHGLPSFQAVRAACGLPVPRSFDDLLAYMSENNVRILRSQYRSIEDLELVVAGSLEQRLPGTQVGPTFHCIISTQFYRSRVGDRYFYENGLDINTAFTPNQLQSIRFGSSIARLVCDNVEGITKIQRKAFQLLRYDTQLVRCDKLPSVDMELWNEGCKISK